MEEYYPSEIARLVLGYLKEVDCHDSWKTFVEESFDLREYYNLYKQGKVYSTNVNGKSLIDTLREYCSFKNKTGNRYSQVKCRNNVSHNEEVKTPSKVTENIDVDQVIQTFSSTPVCQTPKRKSKCRVTQLNFDSETECMDKNAPDNDASVDEFSCSNSAPNSVYNSNYVITDNTCCKSVMTINVELCDKSVQTDLNFNHKDNDMLSKCIQTENLCLCPTSLSKSSQETYQTNCKQNDSCSISSINKINVHNSSIPDLSKLTGYSEQNKHDSRTTSFCDRVEKSFSSSNNKSSTEISDSGKCVESETLLSDEKSQSLMLEKLNEDNHKKEILPNRTSISPVSSDIHQTVTTIVDTVEDMEVADEDVLKDNLSLSTGGTAFEKKSDNSNLRTVNISSISSVRYDDQENIAIDKNPTDIQNKSITNISEPGNLLDINETTEFPEEVSDPSLERNELPRHARLSLENNVDGCEINFNNQEIGRFSNCESQLNNSDVSTRSSNKLDVFNNKPEYKTSNKLTSCPEKCQDSNSEYISSEVEKHQSDLVSLKCKIPSTLNNVDKICADLTGNAGPLIGNEDSNCTEDKNREHNKCLSDLNLERSKAKNIAVSESDLPSANANEKVINIDIGNKTQVKDVNVRACQSSDNNNNQNTVPESNQSTTVVPPLVFNKPGSCFVIPNPSIPTYQNVSSGSFIQNNGQYQYFMFLPVQPVPPVPTVPVNGVNPVLPSPVTVLTSINSLNVANSEKIAIPPLNSAKIPSTVNSPTKQNIAVPSPIKLFSENNQKKGKPAAHLITSSPKHNKIATSEILTSKNLKKQTACITSLPLDQNSSLSSKTPKKKDLKEQAECTISLPLDQNSSLSSKTPKKKDLRKQTACITSLPLDQNSSLSSKTPKKKDLKEQAECTISLPLDQNSSLSSKTPKKKELIEQAASSTGLPLDQNSSLSSKTSKKKDKKSSKKKKESKERDLTKSGIIDGKKSKKKQKRKQNLDKIISSELPSSFTKNLDCHSILSSSKSPGHSKDPIIFKETYEKTDEEDMEKECRVLKVLVSDVLKSSHVRCLDFNVDPAVDKSKKDKCVTEFSEENNRCQLELENCNLSCGSSETSTLIDKNKTSKKVSSSYRDKKRIDTSNKEISNIESISTYKTDNTRTEKNECSISSQKCCSVLPNIEEFNSESINSTDTIVKNITSALESCLDDVPDSIEVVLLSDTEEINNEGETVDSQFVTGDESQVPDCQTINQQNLNFELASVKEVEKIKDHVDPVSMANKTSDPQNVPAVDVNYKESPEVLDNIEQKDATFQRHEIENISSKNYGKDSKQNLADNLSNTKEVGNSNFEVFTAASYDINYEKEDLDSSRSLMINTSPFNEEENEETPILLDSESVENDTSPDCVNDSCYNNVISVELSPLHNSTIVDVTLHNEIEESIPCNINEKVDSSGIHDSPKSPLMSTNSPFKQKSNVNQNVDLSTQGENYMHFQSHNCSEKKVNPHLPQGIVDSVKYFNSQSKTRKHVNVKYPINCGLISLDKNTVRSNTTPMLNSTFNSLQVIDANKCKSVSPCKNLSPIINIEIARNKNLNSSKELIHHLDSSVKKGLNNDVICDDIEKTVLLPKKNTEQFSSRLLDVQNLVTDIDCSYLYHHKIYGSCKKRTRHHSHDSTVNHNIGETLSSNRIMIKSKSSKSLENITNAKLYAQADIHRNYSSAEPVYSPNYEIKASLSKYKITYSNSLSKQNTDVSKNSVNCTSDPNKLAEIVLHGGNSQLPTKVQQTDCHKLSAKRYLLEDDSSSDEDSAVMKDKKIVDKYCNKKLLLEKDTHNFQQVGNYSAKKCMLNNDTLSPVRAEKTSTPDVEVIYTRQEDIKNQTNNACESSKNILRRKKFVRPVEEKLTDDFNQIPGEVPNPSPEKNESQNISEIVSLDSGKDFSCRSVRHKRKSSDLLPLEECSFISCSDDRSTLKKHHYTDNLDYENDSTLTKRPKLGDKSSSPEKDYLSDALEQDECHLALNAMQVDSLFLKDENTVNKSIVKSDVIMEDSPVRYVSKKKKVNNKSALRKRLERDPNIPPGVKIPSKWNTTKIINYSHAIGHSISHNILPTKNIVKNKKRRSRPTLKIATMQSPSKEIVSDKKNLCSKLCSSNCLSEGSAQTNTVCNWVLKEKKQQKSKKPVKKLKKLDIQENIKVNCKKKNAHSTKGKTGASISAASLEAQNQVSGKKMLVQVSPQKSFVVNHCETTQDIVEADIGRSDENGSELANAIASVERELGNSSPDSVPESLEDAIDATVSAKENLNAISDNCDQERTKDENSECVSEHSKFVMLFEKIRSMGVDKVLERIYTLELEKK